MVTLLTLRPQKVGCIWQRCRICFHGASSVGGCPSGRGESLEAELVCDSFERAAKTRGFACQVGADKLFHSDRGSQYASELFGKALKKHGFVPSMSRKANCWDNAVAESFFGTYKSELVAEQPGGQFVNKEQAYHLTADYIENFYNRVRLHSTLDYRSPVMFELAH